MRQNPGRIKEPRLVADVARPDLLGGAERTQQGARDLCHTLREKILTLPDFVEVYPTHVAGSLCGGQEQWQGILNNVENVQQAFGPTQTEIEVVAHGKGLGLLLAANTAMQERLTRITHSGVTLAACENAMRRLQVSKNDLFPFVTAVDSGVAKVVRKQEAGWAYLKGGA